MIRIKNIKTKKGFIVLIAVMVTTIILTVGIGVLNLALREFILANVGRDSVKAFYAADAGVDCAFHHDITTEDALEPNFASPLPGVTNPTSASHIVCNNQTFSTGPSFITSPATCVDSKGSTHAGGCIITTLSRSVPNDPTIKNSALCLATPVGGSCSGPCVVIKVKKIKLSDSEQETQIIANGISDCQSERSVERSLVLTWGATP